MEDDGGDAEQFKLFLSRESDDLQRILLSVQA